MSLLHKLGITASAIVWAYAAMQEIANKQPTSNSIFKYEVMEDTGCQRESQRESYASRRTLGIYIGEELVGEQRELYLCGYSRWGIYMKPVSSKIQFGQKLFVQKADYTESARRIR